MATADINDDFYYLLDNVIKQQSIQETLIIIGDFNTSVGADHEAWPSCHGHFGVAKTNDNGQRLLETCSYHDLCIINTFFSTNPITEYHGGNQGPSTGTSLT